MFLLFKDTKTIWEMSPEERKVTLIILGIMLFILLCGLIYYYFKSRKKD